VLYFDRSGYCIWGKRLEQGQFHFNAKDEIKQSLSWRELQFILEGIKNENILQYKRYCHPDKRADAV